MDEWVLYYIDIEISTSDLLFSILLFLLPVQFLN